MKFHVEDDIANRRTLVRGEISRADILAATNNPQFMGVILSLLADKIAQGLYEQIGPALQSAIKDTFEDKKPP